MVLKGISELSSSRWYKRVFNACLKAPSSLPTFGQHRSTVKSFVNLVSSLEQARLQRGPVCLAFLDIYRGPDALPNITKLLRLRRSVWPDAKIPRSIPL